MFAGRKLRLRHYRQSEELPWIANDGNYDFNYQQDRAITNEVKVMPGDQLTVGNELIPMSLFDLCCKQIRKTMSLYAQNAFTIPHGEILRRQHITGNQLATKCARLLSSTIRLYGK